MTWLFHFYQDWPSFAVDQLCFISFFFEPSFIFLESNFREILPVERKKIHFEQSVVLGFYLVLARFDLVLPFRT